MIGYRVYGISLCSDLPLSFPAQEIEAPDVTLTLESAEWFERAIAGTDVGCAEGDWYEWGMSQAGWHFLRWPGLFQFAISPDGRRIVGCELERSSLESFQTYLLGHVLSFALIKQGLEPLHGTAVVIDDEAVVLLGPSGQGKSTLAATFLHAGHSVLTDDMLVLREVAGVLCGFPGPPRLKLFPEPARRFLPAESCLAPMNPDSNKHIIALPESRAHTEPVLIHSFVVLDGGEGATLELNTITGTSACVELLGATFNRKLVDQDRLRRQFAATRGWCAHVPVRRLSYPWDLEVIESVAQMIVDDVRRSREVAV